MDNEQHDWLVVSPCLLGRMVLVSFPIHLCNLHITHTHVHTYLQIKYMHIPSKRITAIRNLILLCPDTWFRKLENYLKLHSFLMMNLELRLMSAHFKLILCETFKSVFFVI